MATNKRDGPFGSRWGVTYNQVTTSFNISHMLYCQWATILGGVRPENIKEMLDGSVIKKGKRIRGRKTMAFQHVFGCKQVLIYLSSWGTNFGGLFWRNSVSPISLVISETYLSVFSSRPRAAILHLLLSS